MPRGVTLFDERLIQGRVDPDALTYIRKVERSDNASLEPGVKVAINNFVINCKASGLWDKLSLVAIMSGARTLTGALVVLKGPINSLTNTNFVAADYDRRNGFTGDGTGKFFGTGAYQAASEALDDYHIAVNLTTLDTVTPSPVWGFGGTVYDQAQTHNSTVRSRNTGNITVSTWTKGFACVSRNNSSNFDWRNNKSTTNYSQTSVARNADGFRILRSGSTYSTNVINYFAGGKAITELALYDDLVSTLLSDIARAIN
jgi:hypothetical protein